MQAVHAYGGAPIPSLLHIMRWMQLSGACPSRANMIMGHERAPNGPFPDPPALMPRRDRLARSPPAGTGTFYARPLIATYVPAQDH
jgi:hypothetical protein